MKYALIHYHGCKGIAFFLLEKPAAGDRLRRENVRMLDGKIPEGASPCCSSCGRSEGLVFKTSYLEEMADDVP